MDKQQGPTIERRELCSMLCGSLDGKGVWGGMDTHICMAEFLCCSLETITALLISYCSSVVKSCQTLCDPMNCRTSGFPVLHYLPEFAQTHVHWVDDAIQPSHSLSSPSLAPSLSQHQGLFQWVSSLHQVDKVLELQHQSFQWIFRVDFL